MKTQVNFTSSTSLLIAIIRKNHRDLTQYISTILAWGTWGGGTLALFLSPDGGTTKIPLTPSPGGTAVTFAANGMCVITTGTPSNNTDTLELWATLSGATSPNLNVANYDNNK